MLSTQVYVLLYNESSHCHNHVVNVPFFLHKIYDTQMGNVLSKKVSLTDLLFTIEEKINKTQTTILQLKKSKSKVHYTFNIYFALLFALYISYMYFNEQDYIVAVVVSLGAFFVAKYLISLYYQILLSRKEKLLSKLKETQRKNIDELKKQRKYFETKSIVDKYEKKGGIDVVKIEEHRNIIDRVADIVLGDDPAKMYALICERCNTHNGLMHPDEYNLAKYKCKSCGYTNDKSEKNLSPVTQ